MSKILAVVLALLLCGCGSSKEQAGEQAETQKAEADYITVQHILIAFKGTVPGKRVERNREEAESLANDVLRRAQGGEDFDSLVREFTADSHPGIYKMANHGVAVRPGQKMFKRGSMAKLFGDTSFSQDVGQIGMASYDPASSPLGWHIIKRIE